MACCTTHKCIDAPASARFLDMQRATPVLVPVSPRTNNSRNALQLTNHHSARRPRGGDSPRVAAGCPSPRYSLKLSPAVSIQNALGGGMRRCSCDICGKPTVRFIAYNPAVKADRTWVQHGLKHTWLAFWTALTELPGPSVVMSKAICAVQVENNALSIPKYHMSDTISVAFQYCR